MPSLLSSRFTIPLTGEQMHCTVVLEIDYLCSPWSQRERGCVRDVWVHVGLFEVNFVNSIHGKHAIGGFHTMLLT